MEKMQEFAPVDEQLELLKRGAVDVVTEDELRRKLERSRKSGTPLTVKVGQICANCACRKPSLSQPSRKPKSWLAVQFPGRFQSINIMFLMSLN